MYACIRRFTEPVYLGTYPSCQDGGAHIGLNTAERAIMNLKHSPTLQFSFRYNHIQRS